MKTNNETVIAWCQLQQTKEMLSQKQMRSTSPYSTEIPYQLELALIDKLLTELTAELNKQGE